MPACKSNTTLWPTSLKLEGQSRRARRKRRRHDIEQTSSDNMLTQSRIYPFEKHGKILAKARACNGGQNLSTNLKQHETNTSHFLSNKIQTPMKKHDQSYKVHHSSALTICCILIFVTLATIEVKSASTNSGRLDHVLAGESMELRCNYKMKDDIEDIKQVTWSKDGKNFLRWKKNKAGLEVLSYTFKGHIDRSSVFDHLLVHNVSIAMHGKYNCSIKTDLGTHSGEHDVVVISGQQCKLNDWRIHSEQTKCRELFRLDCRNMFPKPVPSCGLWDDKTKRFIRSVSIDMTEEGNHQTALKDNTTTTTTITVQQQSALRDTYRVSYSDRYTLKLSDGSTNPQLLDLLAHAGHLIFKCDILVPETKWNVSLSHKMFNFQDGCNQDPLEAIEHLRSNFSHYASQRMQQAGYHLSAQHSQQPDELEMLTTSLQYEIIPPSHFISNDRNNLADGRLSSVVQTRTDVTHHLSHSNETNQPKIDKNIDLNCWQRPRIGSFAKLSCANQRNGQIKLIGANLLECRPSGWVPVKSSIRNLGEPTAVRRQQAIQKKLAAIAAGRRPTRAERPDGQALQPSRVNPNRVEGPAELGGDEDDDDSSAPRTPHEVDNSTRAPGVRVVDLLEERVRYENEIQSSTRDYEQLSPSELAALLPTCVSVAPSKPRKQTNHLPKLEASMGRNNGRLQSRPSATLREDDDWNWYIFSSSATGPAHQLPNRMTLAICMATMLLVTHSWCFAVCNLAASNSLTLKWRAP